MFYDINKINIFWTLGEQHEHLSLIVYAKIVSDCKWTTKWDM